MVVIVDLTIEKELLIESGCLRLDLLYEDREWLMTRIDLSKSSGDVLLIGELGRS